MRGGEKGADGKASRSAVSFVDPYPGEPRLVVETKKMWGHITNLIYKMILK